MWQLLTLAILLALMIGLEDFNLVAVEDYIGEQTPFTPKSLATTGFIILAAFTTGELFKRFKIPALLGYIVAGILFGPQLIGIVYGFLGQYLPSLTAWVYPDKPPTPLFTNEMLEDLDLIKVLTIGVIGTMGGGELKISDIRESWKLILMTISLMVLTAVPLTVAVIMALPYMPFEIAEFISQAPPASRFGAALLLGILAIAMSPAATLAIIQETRAKGRFTSLALGIVVVADLVLVALFLIGFNISKLLVAPEGFSFGRLAGALPGIGLEFAWALVIGVATGLVFIIYMRYVRKEMMLFTVGMIFAASFVSDKLHAETLLAFLTAGFIVQNFSKHGHDLIHELEKISTPVFIIYFMIQAAKLDIIGVVTYLPLTLLLAALRAGSYFWSARFAARKLHTGETTQRWLWMSFFSRGGVDLVLAEMVYLAAYESGAKIFAWGEDFQTVVMGTVVVHIIAGPPLLKIALGGAGDTAEARLELLQEETSAAPGAPIEPGEAIEFPIPDLESRPLNERLFQMRELLLTLHERHVVEPLESRRTLLKESSARVRVDLEAALEKLEALLADPRRHDSQEARLRSIDALYTQSRRKIETILRAWEKLDPVAFDAASAAALLGEVRNFERFDNQFVVELEEELYDPSTTSRRALKVVRRARRFQRALAGSLRRLVPLGKLWRYYVELSLPRYLERAAFSSSQAHLLFWFELGRYLHHFDAIFETVRHELKTPAEEPIEEPPPTAPEPLAVPDIDETGDLDALIETQEEEEDDQNHAEPSEPLDPFSLDPLIAQRRAEEEPLARASAFLAAARALHSEHSEQVERNLASWLTEASRGYSWSLQQSYTTLLHAVRRAGTLELPGPAYRPSTKFDDARRAESQLAERLERERVTARAYIGWIITDHQLALFTSWFDHYQRRIIEAPTSFFEDKVARPLRAIEERSQSALNQLEEPPPSSPEEAEKAWRAWYRTEVYPSIRSIQRALERELNHIAQGLISRRLIDALEYRVAAFSERMTLIDTDPYKQGVAEQAVETVELPLRQWFNKRLVSEISLRYIEYNERVQRLVRRNQVALESLHHQLSESSRSSAIQEEALEGEASRSFADKVEETRQTASQLVATIATDLEELERWVCKETSALLHQTALPFRSYDLNKVARSLSRSANAPRQRFVPHSALGRLALPPINWAYSRYERVAPLYEELREDLKHLLSDEPRRASRQALRARLDDPRESASSKELPAVYRRLFNPVPLDLPEFYVERPGLEARCLEAIAGWGRGQPNSLLIKGERGVGKRTLIHNIVPLKIYDLEPIFQRTPIETISLPEDAHSEEELCRAFQVLFPDQSVERFDQLTELLLAMPARQALIVENATKIYNRTELGLARCRRFLEVIHRTSARVLWITLIDTPAATLLETALDLDDFFTHSLEIEPLGPEALENMIMNRHRVSGFDLRYAAPHLRLLQRTRHPLAASEMRRNPRRDFFRRLSALSHGNPLHALLLWLSVVRLDPNQDNSVEIHALPERDLALIETLSLEKCLLLAALVQHGVLAVEQLSAILGWPIFEVDTQLEHLIRLGFVEPVTLSAQSYRVCDIAIVELSHELRHSNLI